MFLIYNEQSVKNLSKSLERFEERVKNLEMNSIGIDDFELEQLKKCQQVSKEDFEKFKMETIKHEMNISKEDGVRLTKTLMEMNAYAKSKK